MKKKASYYLLAAGAIAGTLFLTACAEGSGFLHKHTPAAIAEKPATCTENGLTAGVRCAVCGEILQEQTELPALGHVWGNTVKVKDPAAGIYLLQTPCMRCGTISEQPGGPLPAPYMLFLDPQGGELNSTVRPVTEGEPYGSLPEPKREGFSFIGWFTKPVGGEQISAETVNRESAEHCLYAQWKALQYTLDFSPVSNVIITVNRTQSPYGDGRTGELEAGDPVWYGDVLSVNYHTEQGFLLTGSGAAELTVQENITAKHIWAQTEKYTPAPQYLVQDAWWSLNESGNTGVRSTATIEFRDRTANSVVAKIIWTQTITPYSWFGFPQYFSFRAGEFTTGSILIAPATAFSKASVSSEERSVVCEQEFIISGLNPSDTGICYRCEPFSSDGGDCLPAFEGQLMIPGYCN